MSDADATIARSERLKGSMRMSFVSYSQNFEDVLLHRVFGGQETGFYVDVGAYHPVEGSVTKAFYDLGWNGINIEPGSVFEELAAARPRDVNLQMALLDHTGEAAFVEDESDRGMSHVVEPDAARSVRTIPCDTLESVVRMHSRGRPVDFIKIDAEGSEGAIVRSTDWRRLRPRVLVIETTLPWSNTLRSLEWEPGLFEQGYARVYFDGINCFYIPEEEVPVLRRYFQVPVNVLDSATRYDPAAATMATELSAARASIKALQDEHAALKAIHSELSADQSRTGAAAVAVRQEFDRLASALAVCQQDRAQTYAEHAALRQECDALLKENGRLHDEIARGFIERDRLGEAIQSLEAQIAAFAPAPDVEIIAPVVQGADMLPRHPRPVRRALARSAYLLVRPVVRPLAWRLRGFMVDGVFRSLAQYQRHIDEHQRHIDERLQDLGQAGELIGRAEGRMQNLEHALRDHVLQVRQITAEAPAAALAEIRRLCTEMEHVLLTLALDAPATRHSMPFAPCMTPVASAATEEAATVATARMPLLLPGGRTAEVECVAGDLSLSASLAATGGDWEPHVRRFLESVVQPDWTCLDIGANLGAHTLSLATLAHRGRVVAFEADPSNHALLVRNADALDPPKARIEPMRLALWDAQATLTVGGASELAGCSFVTEGAGDATKTERLLRAVVQDAAIGQKGLHVRLAEVPAVPLDVWAEANPLPRLDLIKLDVEGAETRVIRGANRTLRQHRPVLLVEYNPACAAAYFDQAPDALFRELESRFASIQALEPDGSLTPLLEWNSLRTRLETGKGWEDLVCMPSPP